MNIWIARLPVGVQALIVSLLLFGPIVLVPIAVHLILG